ncbi:DUF2637 domain-containing protein [Streptomyces sp. H27-H1]|uniref:DUF2637 domain-containing protein n=1 Tax=Streptomyces sp. H27-H1 TaxID=2996461 RepID=UPI003B63D4FB
MTLGTAGCALSYDALQQMAVAIHVRGFLTYLFPLVVDGFIAYGVRALLVLAEAPLRARLYVWMLFGTATASSIWANALHAVRLNQQAPSPNGLQLGDTVVAVLSTLAPLALAGAVHLYILITRHHPADQARTRRVEGLAYPRARSGEPVARTVASHREAAGPDRPTKVDDPVDQERVDQLSGADAHGEGGDRTTPSLVDQTASGGAHGSASMAVHRPRPATNRADNEPEPEHGQWGKDAGGTADQALAHPRDGAGPSTAGDREHGEDPVPGPPTAGPEAGLDPLSRQASDGPADQTNAPFADPVPLEVLVPIARDAALAGGRMTRRVIGPYLREQRLTISNERFRELQEVLYQDPELAHLPRPKRRTR